MIMQKIKQPHYLLSRFFFMFFVTIVLTSCATRIENRPDLTPVEIKPIHITIDSNIKRIILAESHLYQWFDQSNKELPGFAMYTYVLLNRNSTDAEAWGKYKALVDCLTASVTNVGEHGNEFDRSLYNLFLIPSGGTSSEEFSKSILTHMATSVEDKKLRDLINSNPGPFLITVAKPISTILLNEEVDLLYVDLSGTNVAAIPEVVAAYKKHLTTDAIAGVAQFSSIRLSLLNIILNADDFINIVKVAYAGWLRD